MSNSLLKFLFAFYGFNNESYSLKYLFFPENRENLFKDSLSAAAKNF